MPVDDDKDGTLAREAVKGHLANFRMPDFMTRVQIPRRRAALRSVLHAAPRSAPTTISTRCPKDVAVYAISGWMDGAGYANGTLSRFLTLPNAERRIMLGPWDHGARVNASPWRARIEPELPVLGEVLRFFDQHLAGRETGLLDEAPIHYFTMHAEEWRAAESWPPVKGSRQLLHRARSASSRRRGPTPPPRRPTRPTSRSAAARRRATSASPASTPLPTTPTGRSASASCSRFTTRAARRRALEIAGHPVVSLWLASSEPDAAVFVYLSEVEADGTSRYVTEGVLRAIHRAEAPAPRNYRTTWPWRTFARKDAKPMPVGEPQLLRFALLPTAWRFAAGSRIRLSIAGGDADHFVQTPHGRPPLLTVLSGGEKATLLELPTDG